MTEIIRFKRWAEKQGWFLLWDAENKAVFILPDTQKAVVRYDDAGFLLTADGRSSVA